MEGKHDIAFLKNISKPLRSTDPEVLDLEKMELDGELIFFPLGGSSLAVWTSRLEPLSRPEFHLFDRDNAPPEEAKYQAAADAINNRGRCKTVITAKKEVENYLHFEAINEAYAQQSNIALGITDNFSEFDDVPVRVAEIVHNVGLSQRAWADLDTESQEKKVSKAKRMLNHTAASLMTAERIAQIDPYSEIHAWFAEMKQLIEAAGNE